MERGWPSTSFDYLVGGGEQRQRNCEAERGGGLQGAIAIPANLTYPLIFQVNENIGANAIF